ncbi:hypothetical protein PISL3812_09298 [Talaromyces islandicus]|uniref:Uncharacterized protein n=1 Tax=Talaromyces islandicus TaxID=28573 RepID=A0A0U1MAY9_TALIS|nr:hypothetical protein PISL3812_09298 [Talaromyces islandicus]
MRYITRLNILGGLAFISFLIAVRLVYVSGYGLPIRVNWGTPGTLADVDEGPPLADTADHRLVVFGDAWSYTGARLHDQGRGWPEWVCAKWPCRLETYAQQEHTCEGPFCGSVVDDLELQKIKSDLNELREPLPDLRAQVDRWLTNENDAIRNDPAGGDLRTRVNDTVFAVSFVIWDIWKFLHEPLDDNIKSSISRSIDSLFGQLDRLPAASESDDVRVILMLSIDPTFLPAFDASTGHKDMVSIVEQWNKELQDKAREWRGSIYIFNTNEFLVDQIRAWQYYVGGILDSNGLWEQNPWDDVEHPCAESTGKWMAAFGNEGKKCENPEKFLFWDGMHVGPTANEMMGAEIFHGIETSWIKNAENHETEQADATTPINRRMFRRNAGVSSGR